MKITAPPFLPELLMKSQFKIAPEFNLIALPSHSDFAFLIVKFLIVTSKVPAITCIFVDPDMSIIAPLPLITPGLKITMVLPPV